MSASPTPSGPPIVGANPGSGRKVLLLSDTFSRGDWGEGSYTPVDESSPVNAMAASIGCSSRTVEPIEFRFAKVTGRITVQVAQDMKSANPDLELEYSLTADGRQTEAKNINFKGRAELSSQLEGVTVLRIGVKLSPAQLQQCNRSGSANALITSIVVEQ